MVFKRIFLSLLVSFCSIIATLCVFEISLRIAHFPPTGFSPFVRNPGTGFAFSPNIQERIRMAEYDISFKTNSAGLRDDEISEKKGYRAIFLGDSFTCGFGVERKEQFADLLEKRLNVEVVNAAVAGFETIQEVRFFEKKGYLLKPDLVVYFLYLGNDLSGNGEWSLRGDTLVPKKRDWAAYSDDLRLISLVKLFIYSIKLEKAFIKEWSPPPAYLELCRRKQTADAFETYSLSKQLISRLRDSVVASGSKFMVVLIPISFQVENEMLARYESRHQGMDAVYDFSIPEREITKFLSEQNIRFATLTPGLKTTAGHTGSRMYYAFDGHLTPAGHQAAADILYPAIKKQVSERLQSNSK
jgi:lysophospholipase L1-like esterase